MLFKKSKDTLVSLFSRPLSPQRFFLIIGGGLGLLLVFLIPPFQAPDEHTHFYKEVYQANGGIIAEVQSYRVGANLPAKYSMTADKYKYLFLDSSKKLDFGLVKQDLIHPINKNNRKATAFENTAQYPPLAYIPQTMGIFLVNVFKGPVLIQLYAARLLALITWLVLMFFAIKKLPFAKWGLVALALTPLSIFLSASSSNDAITFGISALFISQVIALICGKGMISKYEKRNLLLTGLALGLCKPPYLILTLLALAIPISRFKNNKHFLKFASLLLFLTFAAAIAWNLAVHKILLNFYPGSDTTEQIKFIINHPISSLIMIVKTLVIYPIGDDLILQLIGLKAWMVAQTPFWLIMANYCLIIVAILYTEPAKIIKNVSLNIFPRVLALALGIIGIFSISLLLYITYTPVGLNTINGLQGRYFIPFSYLLIPIIGGSRKFYITGNEDSLRIIKIALVLIAFNVLPLTVSRYYSL